jgi:hypothetical protein
MSLIDAQPILGFAKAVPTSGASTDAAVIDLPISPVAGFIVDSVVAYNASGDNTLTTIGVFTGAGGTGVTIVANAALGATHAAATGVTQRTVAATAVTPQVRAESLFVRVGTASGVAGSTVDIVVYGRKLP